MMDDVVVRKSEVVKVETFMGTLVHFLPVYVVVTLRLCKVFWQKKPDEIEILLWEYDN